MSMVYLCKVQLIDFDMDTDQVIDTFVCSGFQSIVAFVGASCVAGSLVYCKDSESIRYRVGSDDMRISWEQVRFVGDWTPG